MRGGRFSRNMGMIRNKTCLAEGSTRHAETNVVCGIDFGNLAIGLLKLVVIPWYRIELPARFTDFRSMALRPRLSAGLLLSASTLLMFND